MKNNKNQSRLYYLWLKRLGLLVFAIVLIYAIGRLVVVSLGSYYSGSRSPYLQMLGRDRVVIQWQTETEERGLVRYGTNFKNLKYVEHGSQKSRVHNIQLLNLLPATKYFYSVGSQHKLFKGGTEKDWFVTAPLKTQSRATRIWVLGDPGDWNKGLISVRDATYQWLRDNNRNNLPYLDLIITTGDNAYRSGTNTQFQHAVFEPLADVLRNIPFWPAYGNHDARRWAFYDLFTFPENAELGGIASNTEHFYSFDFANIHFVFLDTEDSSLDKNASMLNWLRRDLLKTRQQWLIAVFHHPPYTKGSHDSDDPNDSRGRLIKVRENVLPILEQYGVDLVLSGHSHMYERSFLVDCFYSNVSGFDPNMIFDSGIGDSIRPYYKYSKNLATHEGAVYVVLGSSSKVDSGPLNHPVHAVNLLELGSMIIDINGNKLTARFINDKMQELDNFTILKGDPKAVKKTSPCVKKLTH